LNVTAGTTNDPRVPQEIERKFLVANDDWRAEADRGRRLQQAYLAHTDRISIRIRRVEDGTAFITIKSAGPARSRHEFEYPLPLSDAKELSELRQGSILEKTRFRVSHAGRVWEIDVYSGENAGLVIAEVELEAETAQIDLPPWVRPRSHRRRALLCSPPGRSALSQMVPRGGGLTMAWRFEPGEGIRNAFRRVSAEEIARVRVALSGPEAERDDAVHESRQAFKRLRALVRLAKPPLGSDFAAEDRRWRDAGRLLSGSRDTTVLLQSFDKLVASRGSDLPARAIERVRSGIAGARARNGAAHMDENLRQVLLLLDEAETSVAALDWPNSRRALLHGFHRGQKRLRRDWKLAHKHEAPEMLHSWRKRVKDQAAQLRLFRRVVPPGFRERIGAEKETAELLGDEHDLWLLAEHLRAETLPSDAAAARDLLLDEIERRRTALRKQAFERGREFSSQKEDEFSRLIGKAWDKASRSRARKGAGKARGNGATRPGLTSPQR